MKTICDKVLEVDEGIRFVMIVDSDGNVKCAASLVALGFSEDSIKQLGGVRTMVVAGITRDLTQYLGNFEFSIIKYQTVHLITIEVKEKIVIFSVEEYPTPKLLEDVRKVVSAK